MKRIRFVALFLLIVLSFSLTSCALVDWLRGFKTDVMEKITTAMDSASSFHAKGVVRFSVDAFEQTVEIDGETEKIVIAEDAFCLFSTEDATVTFGEKQTHSSTMEAYLDGKHFFEASLDGERGSFYSEHTQDTFIEYYKSNLSENDTFLHGYETLVHTENDDGTHTLTLSDYSIETVNTVNALYGFPLENGGAQVRDCVVTIDTNDKYQITRVETEYIFSDTVSRGSQTVECTNYGSAQMRVDRLAVENYTKVSDVRILASLTRLLNERKHQSTGSLTYTDRREVEISNGTSAQVRQVSKVTYGQGEDGYYFDIDMETDDEQKHLTYAEGVYLVDGEVLEWARITNDIEAKAFIHSFIDFCGFHPAMVKDVTVLLDKNGLTSYELTLNEKNREAKDLLTSLMGSVGLPNTGGKKISFCVVVENGALNEVSFDVASSDMQQVSGQLIKLRGRVFLRVKFH